MKHIWKLAAIGLVAAVAFFVISFLVKVVVSLIALGILVRLIYGLGRHSWSGIRPSKRFGHREQYSMQHANAVSIDGDDWYNVGRNQGNREQKITVL